MGPIRKRIYLGNLPFDATAEEVTAKFSKFGNVLNVEMKYQSDTSFDVGLPCYAFLDLNIPSENDLNNCFSKIKSKNWRGNAIKIEIAKESFLSRLEKERKNNKQTAEDVIARPTQVAHFSTELKPKKGNHIKFDEHEVESIEESPKKHKKSKKNRELSVEPVSSEEIPKETNVLDKFESFSDVWKDDPSHEKDSTERKEKRDKKKKKEKTSNSSEEIVISEEISNAERNKIAEERRLKSLAAKEKSVKQQKDAVKLALSSVDSNKKNKRLTFKDDDDDEEEPEIHSQNKTQKNNVTNQSKKNPGLFPDNGVSDEEGEDITFAVKKQFEGKRGQRLLDLKSKYGNDQRFTLDERFYDSDEEKEEVSADVPPNDEIQRQLEILKGIVGDNLPRGPKKTNSGSQKPDENFMLRFDPTKADHRKFELSKDDQSKASVNLQEKNKRKRDVEPPVVEVSKTKYYKVADSLKESLKTNEGGGFSLLEMFGERNVDESNDDDVEMEIQPVDRKSKRSLIDNDNSTSVKLKEKPSEKTEIAPILASWGETFFYKPDDPRLFEGIKFFKTESEDHGFRELRFELRDICRHKLDTARKKAKEMGKSKGIGSGNRGFRGSNRGHRGRH